MAAKAPPVPPENRSPKGPGGSDDVPLDTTSHDRHSAPDTDKQGQAGNTVINTTHQGHQQDR